jgi:hypothetical protein
MPNYKFPLAWSDNRLAHNLQQMITAYRFQPVGSSYICEFTDHIYKARSLNSLADLLVANGLEDGTVQFRRRQDLFVRRHESLYGMVTKFKCQHRHRSLRIHPQRLQTIFTNSGRGLKPDVQIWWNDTLGPASRPWRLREYLFPLNASRAHRIVEEFLEFGTDADMLAFKMRWPELWY